MPVKAKATNKGYQIVNKKVNYKQPKSAIGIAKKAEQIAKKALKEVNDTELKYSTTQLSALKPLETTAIMTNISNVVRGTASTQRIGDKVSGNNITFRYDIRIDTTQVYNFMRVIIFDWGGSTQFTGLPPVAGNILEFADTNSPYKVNPAYQFRILYDKLHTVNTGGAPTVIEKGTIPLNNREYAWLGPNASDYGYRQVWMMLMSDTNTTANAPIFNGTIRFSFKDD